MAIQARQRPDSGKVSRRVLPPPAVKAAAVGQGALALVAHTSVSQTSFMSSATGKMVVVTNFCASVKSRSPVMK